jgi:predicted dehydrogenase
MSRTWKHAVVGTGVVGEWHVRLLGRNLIGESSRLVALCDRESGKAEKAAASAQILAPVPCYTDLGEMLRKEKIDVVHVCTPSGDHMNPAIEALRAGCHVIVEKPMEIQLDRIDRMAEVARESGRMLAGIFQNRWNEANRLLHDAAHEGRFGRIAWAGCFTPWYRTDQYYRDGGWRGTWALDGGGAIMNQSVHAVDLLQWIVGPVRRVSAYAASRIHPEIEVEDTLTCSLQFESGAFGTIQGSTAMWPGSAVRIEVGGENGTAVTEYHLKTFKFREERPEDAMLLERYGPGGGKKTTGGGADPKDVGLERHVQNIQSILASWEQGEQAETNPAEARKAVGIILAMYESARKDGAPVDVR